MLGALDFEKRSRHKRPLAKDGATTQAALRNVAGLLIFAEHHG
jgi:hypothetical protein